MVPPTSVDDNVHIGLITVFNGVSSKIMGPLKSFGFVTAMPFLIMLYGMAVTLSNMHERGMKEIISKANTNSVKRHDAIHNGIFRNMA